MQICVIGKRARQEHSEIRQKVQEILIPELWEITQKFCAKYGS